MIRNIDILLLTPSDIEAFYYNATHETAIILTKNGTYASSCMDDIQARNFIHFLHMSPHGIAQFGNHAIRPDGSGVPFREYRRGSSKVNYVLAA